MLKAELIRPRLEIREGQVWTKPIPADYHYLTIAAELTALFRQYTGRSRGALAEALRDYEGDSLDYPVIRGLAAVLEARCTFGNEPPLNPIDLRATLFQQGPITFKHDLFSQATRDQVVAETATTYGLTPAQIETALFADLAEEQLLLAPGEPFAPGDLIARYNLELARGLLYWAREMRIEVQDGYKDLSFQFALPFEFCF